MCEMNGKAIPYSKAGGITDTLLTNILQTIDPLDVFEEEWKQGIKPF